MSPEGRETVIVNGRPRRSINPRGIGRLVAIIATGALIVLAATLAAADPASPLAVTKTDSVDPVASGQELTYSITTVNTGGAKVNKVILTDQVNHLAGIGTPPQLVLTSTKGSCSQSFFQTYYLVSCSAGSLAGGESWTVTIRGVVTAPDGTTINNTASVTATKAAQNFTTTASATTLVQNAPPSPLADLTITKAGPSSVGLSSPLLYTLTVNNIGAANATGIKVIDTLPAGVDFVAASGNSLFVCSASGGPVPTPFTVTCTGGRVNAGSNATIIIEAVSPAAPGVIENTAVVDPDQTVDESNDLNNTSAAIGTTVTATPTPPPLDITKTDSPDPVTPGGTLEYTIVVTNTGAGAQSRADDVLVVDGTQGLDAASITATAFVNGTPGNCTVIAPQVSCEPPDPNNWLQGGETMTVTITGTVVASAGTTLINTATVTGNIKNQGVSNTATAITEVKPAVDLSITKADQPDPVCARSWPDDPPAAPPGASDLQVCEGGLTYTFVVGNSGISTATGVLVRDALPPGLVFDSFTAPDFAGGCSVVGANVVECTGGIIGPESTSTITIVLVAPPDTGFITNTVKVDPNNAIFEADETNNEFTITTQVKTGIDLTIFKYDEPTDPVNPDPEGPYDPVTEGFDPIATSGTQTYTVIVDNIGTQDAANIRVRDFLPAGTIFLSAEGDNGFQCSYVGEGHYVECVQGAIRGTASEVYFGDGADDARIKIKLFAQPTVTPAMHNEAKVDPLHEIAEANENNNVVTENTEVTTGDATKGAFNELTITKTDDEPAGGVATSSVLTYQIQVTNTGTDPAVNVKVRDFLPAGFVYIEAKDTAAPADPLSFFCSESAGVVDCTGATIDGTLDLLGPAVPQMRTITIKVFSSAVPGIYTNQALVDPDGEIPEGNETNNSASTDTKVTVGAGYIDLHVAKSDTPDPVAPGGVLSYTLTVTNAGTNPAFNVVVRDVLPAGTTFVSADDVTPAPADPTGDFVCAEAGGVVTCSGATLDGSLNLVDVPAGGPDEQPTTRTILITVLAPADIQSLIVPPASLSDIFINITNQAFIDPGNAIPESNETNNAASETTKVQSKINLTLDKNGPSQSVQSTTDNYTITVQNTGTVPALGVVIHDPLPVGLIILNVEADNSNFTCEVLQNPVNVVDCVGDLGPGQTVTVTINIFMTLEEGTFDNEACVDPDNVIEETNETDNCDTKTTSVIAAGPESEVVAPGSCTDGLDNDADTLTDGADPDCQEDENTNPGSCSDGFDNDADGDIDAADSGCPGVPDLNINKSADSGSVTLGQTLTYTLNVSNVGTAAATGVTVTDTLPSAVTFVNVNPTNGFTCSESSGTVTCDAPGGVLAAGASATITIEVTVDPSEDGAGPGTCTDGVDNGGADGIDGDDPDCSLPFTNLAMIASTPVEDGAGAGSCTDTVDNGPDGLTDAADPDCAVEMNFANNFDSVTTSVGGSAIDLVLVSIDDNPDAVPRGDSVTYTILVTNAGTDDASGVEIRDTLSSNTDLSVASATASQGFACDDDISDLMIECTGALLAGQSTIVTIVLQTGAGSPASLTHTVKVDPDGDIAESSEANNEDTEVTTISGSICSSCVDLVISQILGPANATVGSTVEFVFTVGNIGDMSTDTTGLPDLLIDFDFTGSFTFNSATLSGSGAGDFSCPAEFCEGELDPGEGVIITLSVTINADVDLEILAMADPTDPPMGVGNPAPPGAISEFLENNNLASKTVTVDP